MEQFERQIQRKPGQNDFVKRNRKTSYPVSDKIGNRTENKKSNWLKKSAGINLI